MTPYLLPRFFRALIVVRCAAALVPIVAIGISADTATLSPTVISATRVAEPVSQIGSVVDLISPGDISRQQFSSLREALGVSALPLFASGASGAVNSIFLRGANSNQTLFLVDGIRANDPNTDYAVFLGGAAACPCDNLEVSHGPQSTLYGGEAIGGVISVRSQKGEGPPSGRLSAEAGSFGTVQGALNAQGATEAGAYNLSAAGGSTMNDRANNSFRSGTFALRLDRPLTQTVDIGGTLRGFHGRYGDPGSRYQNDPDNFETEDNAFGTVFADIRPTDVLTSHLVIGGQDRRFVATVPSPGRPTSTTLVKNRRGIFDWQADYRGFEKNRIIAGVTAEADTTRNTGFGDINKRQSLFAVFAEDEWTPVSNVFLTGGVRRDDFDTFGSATTGRATAAWRIVEPLKLRASYGTGFRSPSFLDLYGQSAFYVGNPNLKPEKATGGDAGFDYTLPSQHGLVSASWFQTDYRDLIVGVFNTSPSTEANVQKARTQGVELSSKLYLPAGLELRTAYTYTDAKNLTQGNRLLRRPRHEASVDIWKEFGGGFSAGAGIRVVAKRVDIDARTFATIQAEDYTVARIYLAWNVNSRLSFKARIENLLNEKYEEVNGYPALPIGGFAGAEWRF